MTSPRQIIRAFIGNSSLPVYEFDQATVKKANVSILGKHIESDTLDFNMWRLIHAIKKADCARWPTSRVSLKEILGFRLECAYLLDWDASELCLKKGMASYYADFSSSNLAGRIAQGMALLFLENKGYSYVGHFKSEWDQRATEQKKSRLKGQRKSPDFIAENGKKEWVLAESKGSFSGQPDIKGSLKKGLHQLDGWDKYITPQPIKSFVIGTFLREDEDRSAGKTSRICFVDPEPEAPQDPVEFPDDAVRRANYASWLSLMGFGDVAKWLRDGGTGGIKLSPIQKIHLDGNEYAISRISNDSDSLILPVTPPDSLILPVTPPDSLIPPVPPPDSLIPPVPPPDSPYSVPLTDTLMSGYGLPKDETRIEIIGIDLKLLQTLGSSPSSSEMSGGTALTSRQSAGPLDWDGGKFYGSIYSDGSLLGQLSYEDSMKLEEKLDLHTVELWQHTEKN